MLRAAANIARTSAVPTGRHSVSHSAPRASVTGPRNWRARDRNEAYQLAEQHISKTAPFSKARASLRSLEDMDTLKRLRLLLCQPHSTTARTMGSLWAGLRWMTMAVVVGTLTGCGASSRPSTARE